MLAHDSPPPFDQFMYLFFIDFVLNACVRCTRGECICGYPSNVFISSYCGFNVLDLIFFFFGKLFTCAYFFQQRINTFWLNCPPLHCICQKPLLFLWHCLTCFLYFLFFFFLKVVKFDEMHNNCIHTYEICPDMNRT